MKNSDYIGLDLCGFRFNKMYPPDKEKYGIHHGGYRNNAEEVLFYDFAVQFYDVSFVYKGRNYYFLTAKDHVAVCDSRFTEEYETFDNALDLIENFTIDGHRLIDIIDDLEEVEPI